MQYYKLMFDDNKKRKNDIMLRPVIDVKNPYTLLYGQHIEEWNTIMFEYNPAEGHIQTDYMGNVYGWPILSEKAAKLFSGLIKNDIQMLPIKILNKDTRQAIDEYFVLNILSLIEALDLENSVYNYVITEGKKELAVIKYGIKETKVIDHHIFRLKESPFAIFVSKEFKKVAEDNTMLGMEFLKVKMS